MMRCIVICAATVLVISSLSACNMPLQTQGPTTWIDQPLNGVQVPLAPLTIQAHASDADGVAAIEFYAFENLLAAVPAGGARLGEASTEWMPPQGGNYTIISRAVDSQGNFGPSASVQIVVGVADVATETPTPAAAPGQCTAGALTAPALLSPADGATVGPDPLLAWSYPDESCHPHSYRIDISEEASFSDVGWGFGTLDYNETSRSWPLPAGKCYYWRALAYVPDVNGPASSTWHFCVAGTVSAPPLSTEPSPPTEPPLPTEPPADTTPPDIADFNADPPSIQREGCGEPSTTTIGVTVTDAGGVSRVMVRVPGYGEFETQPVGGDVYQVTLGPFSDTGEYSILIFAWDNAENGAQAGPFTVTVVCIG